MGEEKEIWKVYYEGPKVTWTISNQGRVKRNGKLYECKLDRGYKIFGYNYTVHRAVAELFIPNPENKPCVDHINTNKLDNRVCNLRWVTYSENNNNPITRKHISEAKSGKILGPQSEEHKRNRSKSMKGKILGSQSKEHRKNISESMKRYWQNKKLSNTQNNAK